MSQARTETNGNGSTIVQNQCDIAKSVQERSSKQYKSD